jgi:hypothetical protein
MAAAMASIVGDAAPAEHRLTSLSVLVKGHPSRVPGHIDRSAK